MIEEDIYTYKKLPWMSKSTILGYRFCQHLFDLRYNRGKVPDATVKAETGTNMHTLYYKFFDEIDYDHLRKFVLDYTRDTLDSEVYHYFYKVLMEMIPLNSRSYKPYQNMVKNFALLEADHWINLMRTNKNIEKVYNSFKPIYRERYLECPDLMIFGTVDRLSYYEDIKDMKILYDYKTGYIPADVRKGTKSSDPFSWTLPTKKNFEMHFYLILEMYREGFHLAPEIVDYCTQPQYFGEKVPILKTYFLDKDNNPVKPKDYLRVGFIFTGDEELPYIPKKVPSKRSLTSVFSWINKIRKVIYDNGPYLKEPSFWKCRECNDDIRNECLSAEEEKMIFWEKKDD